MIYGFMEFMHVYPKDDVIEHNIEDVDCICGPVIDIENGIITHCALDGRG